AVAEALLYFEGKLQDIAARYPSLFEKEVGIGLMRGLRAKSAEIQAATIKSAMKEGLVILKAGRNTVRFLPSITITKAEIDEGFKRLESALKKVSCN
ncbi:MAG: aminotransferase class III-fold pyridoxal phosphate-dependent enzyme, partial [Sulfurovum sp.]